MIQINKMAAKEQNSTDLAESSCDVSQYSQQSYNIVQGQWPVRRSFETGEVDDKVIWFTVTKMYETDSLQQSVGDGELKLLGVRTNCTESVKLVSNRVCQMLGLDDSLFVLQLRNSQGSFIPLNGRVTANTRETPYRLDVLAVHQRVQPMPRSVAHDCYAATILNQTRIFLSRLANLENTLPELKQKRNEKIQKEVLELEEQLKFLQKRFDDADKTQWMGIIKKSPLW